LLLILNQFSNITVTETAASHDNEASTQEQNLVEDSELVDENPTEKSAPQPENSQSDKVEESS
jgi:hypothetical protein